jgi:uncharacterized alkaline shock family protein YloU
VAQAVRNRVQAVVEHMTGLACGSVGVRVGGVAPPPSGGINRG